MAKSKTIPFSKYIEELHTDPVFQEQMAQLKAFKKQSPAEFERKFNKELMDLGMEINHRAKMIGVITEHITDTNVGLSPKELDFFYDERTKEIYALAKAQQKRDDLVAKLDLNVHNEKAMKSLQ